MGQAAPTPAQTLALARPSITCTRGPTLRQSPVYPVLFSAQREIIPGNNFPVWLRNRLEWVLSHTEKSWSVSYHIPIVFYKYKNVKTGFNLKIVHFYIRGYQLLIIQCNVNCLDFSLRCVILVYSLGIQPCRSPPSTCSSSYPRMPRLLESSNKNVLRLV